MNKQIECGQIWKLKNIEMNYNMGSPGEIFIVLSLDNDAWLVGCFWEGNGKLGGARLKELTETEIREIGEYVGSISIFKLFLSVKGAPKVNLESLKEGDEVWVKLNFYLDEWDIPVERIVAHFPKKKGL